MRAFFIAQVVICKQNSSFVIHPAGFEGDSIEKSVGKTKPNCCTTWPLNWSRQSPVDNTTFAYVVIRQRLHCIW